MDLEIIGQVVGIVGGVVATIRSLVEMSNKTAKDGMHLPNSVNVGTRFALAVGMVVFLYGAVTFVYSTTKMESAKRSCLQGQNAYSFTANQECNEEVNSVFKPALIAIGSSFVLIALALFIRNLSTASVFEFTLELILITLGGWLIRMSL